MTHCTILPMHRTSCAAVPVAIPADIVSALVEVNCASNRALRFCERIASGQPLPSDQTRHDLPRLLGDVRRAAAMLPKGGV